MEEKVATGFDRNIDYEEIKDRLVKYINDKYIDHGKKKKITDLKNIAYGIVACIQLRNGSRISEAVKAYYKFIDDGISKRVIVKISKSDAMRKNKDGEMKKKKARFREMMFPNWFNEKIFKLVKKSHLEFGSTLKKRVLDFMANKFSCNTHSLRYAFINYMLYVQKRPMNDVAKFVGHVNVNQLVTYTQQKNCNQIFDLDI